MINSRRITSVSVFPVQKVEDKKILILMSSEMYMGNPYTVVFYNDITEIYERTARLFAKGLMMTLILLLLAGGILYRSLSYPLLSVQEYCLPLIFCYL